MSENNEYVERKISSEHTKICEQLALLAVIQKSKYHYDDKPLSNGQLYRLYQENYFPENFVDIVGLGLSEDI